MTKLQPILHLTVSVYQKFVTVKIHISVQEMKQVGKYWLYKKMKPKLSLPFFDKGEKHETDMTPTEKEYQDKKWKIIHSKFKSLNYLKMYLKTILYSGSCI